ncbi:uncharacterized protein MTES_0716 [Microbacterium testaceum StLB037]|uniref:Uncharacterized protein n=1 Tax=Microbacterium testaceum (strain StLB037) TaxID=979556 RepID=E8ND41_MICTS|nr:hypothetical protein [Microbacterium testaceum]BAJ73680.1 uncharacterized protein MTES_0716 [Microbacterium testaceum StLB037]
MQMTNVLSRRRRSLGAAVLVAAALGGTSAGNAGPALAADGEITYTLHTEANPTADQQDAYAKITAAVDAAVTRYNNLSDLTKQLNVSYAPGVPTAEGNGNGDLRFGENRSYMSERTALHEIAHTLGVDQSSGWSSNCSTGTWTGPNVNALIKSWDGDNATISCGGGHFWPYGLNYDNEWSEQNADRHVLIVNAMKADGM